MREYAGEKLADELLSLCQLINRPQYLPKMPTRSELPSIFEDRFSDSQPYLFRIESDYGKQHSTFHENPYYAIPSYCHSNHGSSRQVHGRIRSGILLRPQAVQGHAHLLQLIRLSWNTSAVPASVCVVRLLSLPPPSHHVLNFGSGARPRMRFPHRRQLPTKTSEIFLLFDSRYRCTSPLFRRT